MRIADTTRNASVLRTIQDLRSRQADAQARALTGRQVNKPSDDPAAAAELARIRASSAQADNQLKAASVAKGDVELAEGVLAQAGDLFQQAHDLAMQGANGSMDAATRASLASQVQGIKDQLVGLANTQGATGYLFGGSKTTTQPFATSGAFSGDNNDHVVDLGGSSPTSVGVSGADAFTAAGGRDVFADLDSLVTALNSNSQSGIQGTLANLEASRKQLTNVRALAGIKIDRLNTTEDILGQAKLALAQREETTAGADPYQAYSDLVTLGQSLEQAVGIAKKILDLGDLFRI
ncbi:MAG TPA: flagellar hook-associated protein FlgL [Polyangiaceae bacterium]|nr:flagellar hook-associated protein FlgL [Polyangiaceae bacterium]